MGSATVGQRAKKAAEKEARDEVQSTMIGLRDDLRRP
jgi:hypothetical protein